MKRASNQTGNGRLIGLYLIELRSRLAQLRSPQRQLLAKLGSLLDSLPIPTRARSLFSEQAKPSSAPAEYGSVTR